MLNDDHEIILDLESARRNFDGDASLVRDIGQIFVEDVPLLVQQLNVLRADALQTSPTVEDVPTPHGPLLEARRVAHSIKGLANTFGAEPLGSLLATIERDPNLLIADDGEQRLMELERIALQTVDELVRSLSSEI
jgi:HPt (histidine-containing phosphotransfer) domain-containing protein